MVKIAGAAIPIGGVDSNGDIQPAKVNEDGELVTTGSSGGASGVEYNATPPTLADGETAAAQADVNGNTKVTQATGLVRTYDSVTVYQAPCELTIVDLATDADVVVTSSPAVLLGVYVDTVMSAHAALIKDGSTTKLTLPASTAAGTKIDTHSASFSTSITVESDNAATGKLAIFWRAV